MSSHVIKHHYLMLAAISLSCAAVLASVGYGPTLRLAGSAGIVAMLTGIGVSLLAGLLSAIPVVMSLGQPAANRATAILLATGIRFLFVLFAVAALVLTAAVEVVPFVVWVAMSYLVLLLVDTLMAVSMLKRNGVTS